MVIAMVALASLSCAANSNSGISASITARSGTSRLRETLKELDIEFNGVDFGHSNLYENLLLTGAKDVPAIEDKARKETLQFIATRPTLNPNEEAIAPTYMKLAWKAQNTFDEAHALAPRDVRYLCV